MTVAVIVEIIYIIAADYYLTAATATLCIQKYKYSCGSVAMSSQKYARVKFIKHVISSTSGSPRLSCLPLLYTTLFHT